MENNATESQVDSVVDFISSLDLKAEVMPGPTRTSIGVIGNKSYVDQGRLVAFDGVKEIIHVTKPYKLVSREFKQADTIVDVGGVQIGDGNPVMIAGPCSVESYDQLNAIAEFLADNGAQIIRGGAFKPRTSPYSFQGLEEEGLQIIKKVKEKYSIPFVTEITDADQLDLFLEYEIDMLQIGARNMYNYSLLKKVAKTGKPILLKRGMSASFEEFMLAAEYILNEGNKNVILCERGIRTFENSTRNILDLNTLALVKKLSHLPIIADPSHAAGHYDLVENLGLGAIAAGADGVIVEVHNDPKVALSDGAQSLNFETYKKFETKYEKLKKAIN
jgi:3-deoxy-7-phosphoheptulonate synthase